MKELSIEEKAKAYDEAIEIARQIHDADRVSGIELTTCEEIFPELKESEDEKIRKSLIQYVKNWIAQGKNRGCVFHTWTSDEKECNEILAWLEKQGEKIIPLEEIILNVWELGNYWKELTKGVCNTEYGRQLDYIIKHWKEGEHYIKYFEKQDEQPKKHDVCDYCDQQGSCVSPCPMKLLEKQGEQKPIEWKQDNVEDLTDFENAMMHIGCSFFSQYAGLDPNDTNAIKEQAKLLLDLVPKQEWSEEDEKMIESIIKALYGGGHFAYESEIDWLKSLKDRVQPKQEWSEEEIETCAREAEDNNCIILAKHIRQLKSLRPQSTWKPSEEQMKALHDLNLTGSISYTGQGQALIELYKDIKKL